ARAHHRHLAHRSAAEIHRPGPHDPARAGHRAPGLGGHELGGAGDRSDPAAGDAEERCRACLPAGGERPPRRAHHHSRRHPAPAPRSVASGLVSALIIQVVVIRPLLNRRTDAVLAGIDDGGSALHLFYIAADGLLIVGLVAALVLAGRRWVPIRPQ